MLKGKTIVVAGEINYKSCIVYYELKFILHSSYSL